jgi:catechol 2,3-dioxygenase-like lactoylglutathione lyase family enzyme
VDELPHFKARRRRTSVSPEPLLALSAKALFARRTRRASQLRAIGNRGGNQKMFSHVMVGTNDLEKAKAFYDALLGTLDIRPARVDGHRIFYITKSGVFAVSKPIDGKPATPANGGTIGFTCDSPEQAAAWHAAGIVNGATTCEDPPGVREGAGGKVYLAYLRDLDGNKICATHRMS